MFRVVIPTIGRPSLDVLVSQILMDAEISGIELEIIVALNGNANLNYLSSGKVRILIISETPIGVAKTMNLALSQIPEGLVWTIADDEEWCVGKFESDLSDLKMDKPPEILSPIAYFTDELGTEIRPRRSIARDEDILDYFYGRISMGRNPNYFSLSGAVATKSTWLRVKFPEDLKSREDTLYLVMQQKQGTSLGHASKPTVKINIELQRAVNRDDRIEDVIQWANRNLNQRQFRGFVGCAWCKPFVASRNPKKLLEMLKTLILGSEIHFSRWVRLETAFLVLTWAIISIVPLEKIKSVRTGLRTRFITNRSSDES
jgi:hypothetical protein